MTKKKEDKPRMRYQTEKRSQGWKDIHQQIPEKPCPKDDKTKENK